MFFWNFKRILVTSPVTDNYSIDKNHTFVQIGMSSNTIRGSLFGVFVQYQYLARLGKINILLIFFRAIFKKYYILMLSILQ